MPFGSRASRRSLASDQVELDVILEDRFGLSRARIPHAADV
jgi:hypothetical protein